MLYWQLIGGFAVLAILMIVLNRFLSEFRVMKKSFCPMFLILILFATGFAFRLSQNHDLIDLGFFFTDISYLFTYVIFTICLILGQKKYWRA